MLMSFDVVFGFPVAVQPDAEMSTRDDPQGQQDVLPTLMEDQLRQLQLELKEKNERVEQLEALLADEDRLAQLETLERLEADWNREHELVENEREEEMRLLQEVHDIISLYQTVLKS